MMYYTGIGSRKAPGTVLSVIEVYAYRLARLGYILRSGGAVGCDNAFEKGCDSVSGLKQIFMPSSYHEGRRHDGVRFINATSLPKWNQALDIMFSVHPLGKRLHPKHHTLHGRNIFQVLGANLYFKSDFVVCYAESEGIVGNVKGGTNTAVELALRNSIPVYNLYIKEEVDSFEELLYNLEKE